MTATLVIDAPFTVSPDRAPRHPVAGTPVARQEAAR